MGLDFVILAPKSLWPEEELVALCRGYAKESRMPALVYATYGKGTARPGGRLLKNQRDILAL